MKKQPRTPIGDGISQKPRQKHRAPSRRKNLKKKPDTLCSPALGAINRSGNGVGMGRFGVATVPLDPLFPVGI